MHFSGENGCQLCFLQGTNLWLPWPGNSFSLSLTLSLSFLAQPSMPEFAWAGRWLPAARGNTVCFHFFKTGCRHFFPTIYFYLAKHSSFFFCNFAPGQKTLLQIVKHSVVSWTGQEKCKKKKKPWYPDSCCRCSWVLGVYPDDRDEPSSEASLTPFQGRFDVIASGGRRIGRRIKLSCLGVNYPGHLHGNWSLQLDHLSAAEETSCQASFSQHKSMYVHTCVCCIIYPPSWHNYSAHVRVCLKKRERRNRELEARCRRRKSELACFPTGHFAILELQNPWNDVLKLPKLAHFEALK